MKIIHWNCVAFETVKDYCIIIPGVDKGVQAQICSVLEEAPALKRIIIKKKKAISSRPDHTIENIQDAELLTPPIP